MRSKYVGHSHTQTGVRTDEQVYLLCDIVYIRNGSRKSNPSMRVPRNGTRDIWELQELKWNMTGGEAGRDVVASVAYKITYAWGRHTTRSITCCCVTDGIKIGFNISTRRLGGKYDKNILNGIYYIYFIM